MKIKDYFVIHCDPDCLEQEVKKMLALGWQPFGNPYYREIHSLKGDARTPITYPESYQAMVQYKLGIKAQK